MNNEQQTYVLRKPVVGNRFEGVLEEDGDTK